MSTTQIIVIVVLAIAIVFVLATNIFAAPTKDTTTIPNSSQSSPTTITSGGGIDMNKILSRGSSGAEVSELQRQLNSYGETLSVDGQFGNLTEAALERTTCEKSIKLKDLATKALNKTITGCNSWYSGGLVTGQNSAPAQIAERWCSYLPGSTCYNSKSECEAANSSWGLAWTCTKY